MYKSPTYFYRLCYFRMSQVEKQFITAVRGTHTKINLAMGLPTSSGYRALTEMAAGGELELASTGVYNM